MNRLAGSLANFSESEVGKGSIETMKTGPFGNRAWGGTIAGSWALHRLRKSFVEWEEPSRSGTIPEKKAGFCSDDSVNLDFISLLTIRYAYAPGFPLWVPSINLIFWLLFPPYRFQIPTHSILSILLFSLQDLANWLQWWFFPSTGLLSNKSVKDHTASSLWSCHCLTESVSLKAELMGSAISCSQCLGKIISSHSAWVSLFAEFRW